MRSSTQRRDVLLVALFALALVTQLLPFVVIGRMPLSGLALGFTAEGSALGGQVKLSVLGVVWFEAVGLFLGMLAWKRRPGARELKIATLALSLVAAFLLLLIREPLAMLQATYEAGYWLSLLALVGAAIVSLATLLESRQGP